jgi:hypothetical protein
VNFGLIFGKSENLVDEADDDLRPKINLPFFSSSFSRQVSYRCTQIYGHMRLRGDEKVTQSHGQVVGNFFLNVVPIPGNEPGKRKHGSNIRSAEKKKFYSLKAKNDIVQLQRTFTKGRFLKGRSNFNIDLTATDAALH